MKSMIPGKERSIRPHSGPFKPINNLEILLKGNNSIYATLGYDTNFVTGYFIG